MESGKLDFNSHARVGRDDDAIDMKTDSENFNSHARVGRDKDLTTAAAYTIISTHTPAWGVTLTDFVRVFPPDFNSHARVGRDS